MADPSIIGRIFLVIINIVMVLLSLAMLVIGIIILAGQNVYKSISVEFQEALEQALKELGVKDVDTANLSLSHFLAPMGYSLVAVGVLIFLLSLAGCIGGCCRVKCCLVFYIIFTALSFLGQLFFVISIYANRSVLDKAVKPGLRKALSDYAGIAGTNVETITWNALMANEQCCGIDDYTDFQNLEHWPAPINNTVLNLTTPVVCCKWLSRDVVTKNGTCATDPTNSDSNWKTGCYDKLFEIVANSKLIMIVSSCLLTAQFLLIVCAIWVLCAMRNDYKVF